MKHKLKVISCLLPVAILLGVALFAPEIAPYDPWKMNAPYLQPSADHLLGTNDLGQDIFSELIYGSRVSLFVGVTASVIITFFGTLMGVAAAYFGRWVDRFVMLLINVNLAIPTLPLIIVLAAFLNKSIWNILLCLCITGWAGTARIVRTQTMKIREMGYIKSAKTMGGGTGYIMLYHILPNLKEIVITKGLLSVASAMLTETSISYLGLGSPLMKSWGSILNDAFRAGGVFNGYWWWYIPPILCISVTIFCFLSLRGIGDSSL